MDRSSSCGHPMTHLISILRGQPQAAANVAGSMDYPDISGTVRSYQTNERTVVLAEVSGLPRSDAPCQGRIFGSHIHGGTRYDGGMDDPFPGAMAHYDPGRCEHPYHAGDLPPLFGNDGHALSLFLTDRFSVDEAIGPRRAVMPRPSQKNDLATLSQSSAGLDERPAESFYAPYLYLDLEESAPGEMHKKLCSQRAKCRMFWDRLNLSGFLCYHGNHHDIIGFQKEADIPWTCTAK